MMNKNRLEPQLRFPEFSGDWEEKRLGDVFNITAGGDIDKTLVSEIRTNEYNIPIFANALSNNGLYGYTKTAKILKDSITVTGRGDIGFAVARHEPYYPIVRLLNLLPKHDFNIDFGVSAINNIKILSESTGVPQLTAPQISNYKIGIPHIDEQNRIASFFSKLDEEISLTEKKIDLLEQRKKGYMQKIFSQELRFKAVDGSEFPEWEEKRLGDVAQLKNGYSFKSGEYIKDDSIGKYRIITIGNVTGDKYVSLEKVNCINEIPSNIQKHQILKNNDILVSLTGNVGRISLNKGENNLLNQRVGLIDTNLKIVNFGFIYYVLSDIKFEKAMLNAGNGLAQLNIGINDIHNYMFNLPCLEEQQKISSFLSTLDIELDIYRSRLSSLKERKHGLMQRMFV